MENKKLYDESIILIGPLGERKSKIAEAPILLLPFKLIVFAFVFILLKLLELILLKGRLSPILFRRNCNNVNIFLGSINF